MREIFIVRTIYGLQPKKKKTKFTLSPKNKFANPIGEELPYTFVRSAKVLKRLTAVDDKTCEALWTSCTIQWGTIFEEQRDCSIYRAFERVESRVSRSGFCEFSFDMVLCDCFIYCSICIFCLVITVKLNSGKSTWTQYT